jgi:hypothetical protein
MMTAKVGSICATVVAFAMCVVAVQPAHAQFFLWPHFRAWGGSQDSVRHTRRHKDSTRALTKSVPAKEKSRLQIIISIADQRISVYDGETLVAHSSVSTGVPDHPTPFGVFSVISKRLWHRSNLYSDAPMPYMQRITWSGIALHAGRLPGYPASHGCIRLERSFALRLWHLARRGTRVIIAPNDVRPVEIADPHLFPFKARATYSLPKTAEVIAGNAMSDAAPSLLSVPPENAMHVGVEGPVSAARKIPAPKPAPISILVSRHSNKLFVRQGSSDLFEAPVTIREPAESLGTHVFTLVGLARESMDFRWTVVSIPEGPPRALQRSTKQQKPALNQIVGTPQASSPNIASAALSRIEMPPDAVERIAGLLAPGSSLIVTDHGMSKETGSDTDFIVETKGFNFRAK